MEDTTELQRGKKTGAPPQKDSHPIAKTTFFG